jgi:hypothetical protein
VADLKERLHALEEVRWPDLWPGIEARARESVPEAARGPWRWRVGRRLVPAGAVALAALVAAVVTLVPRPQSALAIVEEARQKFEHVPPFHAIIAGHVPAEIVARDTGGKVSTEAVYRWELWYQSGDSWRFTLLENSVPSDSPGTPDSFLLRTGDFSYRYEAASNSFVATPVGGPHAPAVRFASPFGELGWDEAGDNIRACEDSGGRLEVLPDEEVAGRTARHIRCGTLFDVWIDAETGQLLRLARPDNVLRSLPEGPPYEPNPLGFLFLTPGDRVEVASIEYNPVFPPGIFEFVPPEGAREVSLPAASPPPSSTPGAFENTFLVKGLTAPTWTGRLLDGGTLDLASLQGRPVVVLFWSDTANCSDAICGVSLRQLQRAFGEQKDRIRFASVELGGSEDGTRRVVAQGRYDFPVVFDPTDEIGRLWFPSPVFPVWVLLDAEGRAADVRLGVISDQEFRAWLAQVER